eukprot:2814584-Rhodomonas_salina.1
MPALLLLASVVLVPSLVPEAFCRVVVEALAMHRPVVLANPLPTVSVLITLYRDGYFITGIYNGGNLRWRTEAAESPRSTSGSWRRGGGRGARGCG